MDECLIHQTNDLKKYVWLAFVFFFFALWKNQEEKQTIITALSISAPDKQ